MTGTNRFSAGEKQGGTLCIIFEHCEGGSLHATLKEQRQMGRYLSERAVLKWFIPILEGVLHLHNHGVIHRDLKSLNIVLHKSKPKICDLGISREKPEGALFLASHFFPNRLALSTSPSSPSCRLRSTFPPPQLFPPLPSPSRSA